MPDPSPHPSHRRPDFVPFAAGIEPSEAPDPTVLGAKGAGLVAMGALGLPVPAGFVIPIAVARDERRRMRALSEGVAWLEERTKRRVGGATQNTPPLLVSVRSGAAVSMPGMMDTVLNVGATAAATRLLQIEVGETFARDCRRRFLRGFARVVGGTLQSRVEEASDADLESAVADHLSDDARADLTRAADAVVDSWSGERAERFRAISGLAGEGTAVIVQAMVFGNRDDRSGTGVLQTRDPATGARDPVGEWLAHEQGEVLVGGRADPVPLKDHHESLEHVMPDVFADLVRAGHKLERQAGDAQEIEFTVESGRLWLLQTRSAKRDGAAHWRIAVDMVREGLISKHEAVARTDPIAAAARRVGRIEPGQDLEVLVEGLPASGGAATGRVVLDADAALRAPGPVVLVRSETSPEDVAGMNAAAAILTARGGRMSHAAAVARAFGKPCVTGARGLVIDERGFRVGNRRIRTGEAITIDGHAGRAYAGVARIIEPEPDENLSTLLDWAREV